MGEAFKYQSSWKTEDLFTNYYTKTETDSLYVPYTGAVADVDLGVFDLTTAGKITINYQDFITGIPTATTFLKVITQFVPDGAGGTFTAISGYSNPYGNLQIASNIAMAFNTDTFLDAPTKIVDNTIVVCTSNMSNAVDAAYGVRITMLPLGPYTITAAYGVQVNFGVVAGGIITSGYGIYISNPVAQFGGSMGTNYGLYIAAQTFASTNYAIYAAGGQSVHAGNLRVGGATNPAVALDVTGAVRISTTLSMADDQLLSCGNPTGTTDAAFQWETTGNDNFQLGLVCGAATDSGYFSIMEKADLGNANRSPLATSTNPVLRIYSADAGVATDYGELFHDQTDFNLRVSAGKLKLGGIGITNNETLLLDFETVANTIGVSSDSGATDISWGSLNHATFGNLTFSDAKNIAFNTSTGTKIGTGTTQKLGFWNATPVAQSTGWGATNTTPDKAFDADATTLDEVADALGSLINQLQTYGLLGA